MSESIAAESRVADVNRLQGYQRILALALAFADSIRHRPGAGNLLTDRPGWTIMVIAEPDSLIWRRSVGENLKKGTRVTGADRGKLATELGKRYEAGESIRSLAASSGRSYGFVQRILTETGVRLRGRSGSTRVRGGYSRSAMSDTAQPQIPVQIFLADAAPGPAVEEALREVLLMSGVEDVRKEELVIRSWYRSLTGLLKRAADSDAAAEARRAVELQVLDRFQATIDGVTGDAVAKLSVR
jgi:hypothetical protein